MVAETRYLQKVPPLPLEMPLKKVRYICALTPQHTCTDKCLRTLTWQVRTYCCASSTGPPLLTRTSNRRRF